MILEPEQICDVECGVNFHVVRVVRFLSLKHSKYRFYLITIERSVRDHFMRSGDGGMGKLIETINSLFWWDRICDGE